MMSGTSVDAIDLAVAEFSEADGGAEMRLVWHGEAQWDDQVRARILGVLPPASSDVATWCRLEAEVGQEFARAACEAIAQAGDVDLIASHGQTLHHWVEDAAVKGSLQIGNPAWIQAATGTPVISDFRSADIAAGGQGAPLASTFDALWLGEVPTAALNLGGIANITVVGRPEGVMTGDTGPASCLLDAAAQRLQGLPADLDGALASAGTVNEEALERLLAEPFYARPLPKSTGREYFHAGYVADLMGADAPQGPDLFATLTELTARTVAAVVNAAGVARVVGSGGGMRNPELVRRLRAALDAPLLTSTELGLASDAKEAYVFALLGYLSATGRPGVVPGVDGRAATGADSCVVLGTRSPAANSETSPVPLRRITVCNEEES
jgi:anhydro-N-acetylmuramic acid kinase